MKRSRLASQRILLIVALGVFGWAAVAAEISRDARRYMARGQAAMEVAKDVAGYGDAVREFRKAVDSAPGWADAWFNLGVAQEAAEDYAGAMESFRRYLQLGPGASDRQAVEDRIFGLEYKQEKKSQAPVQEARSAEAQMMERLAGEWRNDNTGNNSTVYYQLDVAGANRFELYRTRISHPTMGTFYYKMGEDDNGTHSGTVDGDRVYGTWHSRSIGNKCPYHEAPFSGEILDGGKVMILRWTTPYIEVGGVKCDFSTANWKMTLTKR